MTWVKVAKLSFSFLALSILFFGAVFFVPQKAKAADSDIVINEVMANPKGSDTSHEWIELYNFGPNAINLTNWQIKIFGTDQTSIKKTIKFGSVNLSSNDYLVVVANAAIFVPCSFCDIYDGQFGSSSSNQITNSSGKLALLSADSSYEYDFSWSKDVGDGYSMEIIGPPVDPDYQNWLASLNSGGTSGTPGAKNSVSQILPPQPPTHLSPADGAILSSGNVDFSWESEPNTTWNFKLSSQPDLSSPLIDDVDLAKNSESASGLDWGTYYWRVTAVNLFDDEADSTVYSFTIPAPVYSDAVMINEILPNPFGDQTSGEWIELYNNSEQNVNLYGWGLEDLEGSIHRYTINYDLNIEPFGYIVIYRSESGITLNDDVDGVSLFWPDGTLLYTSAEFSKAQDDVAWARAPDGAWAWTTNPTPGEENDILAPGDSVTTTVKKAVAAVKAAAKKTTSGSAKAATVKTARIGKPAIAGANSNGNSSSSNNNSSVSFWSEFFKATLAIAIIFLIYLIFIIFRRRKERVTIGGHFGEDDT